MTRSYERAQLRRYKQTHPWVRKLPKGLVKKDRSYEDPEISYIPGTTDYLADQYNEMWDRIEGDGSWAIVYDENREGEWLWELADNGWVDHVCSECKFAINTDFHVGINYPKCPRCGARMTNTHGVRLTDENILLY